MKVLLIGDEVSCSMLRPVVAAACPQAVTEVADDINAALAAVECDSPDAVLFNKSASGPVLEEFLDRLRSQPCDAPVIAILPDFSRDAAAAWVAAGAADCLPSATLTPDLLAVAIDSSIRSVAAERRYRDALRQNAFYAALVAATDDAVVGKTLEGTILSWNVGAERLYGYRAEDMIGRNIAILAPPDRLEELENAMARLRNGMHVPALETIRVTKAGDRLDVSLTISPIRDSAGDLIGASTIARNITQLKETERLLRARLEQDSLVHQIGQAALWSDDPAAFQASALELLGERLDVDRCFYVLYDELRNTATIEKDWCRGGVRSLEGEWPLAERDIAIRDIYAWGNTEVVNDVVSAALPRTLIDLFVETGQRAYIAVPFFDHGRPVAALTVMMASEPRQWTRDEVVLVEAAAVQVRGAVEWSRARQRERDDQIRRQTFLREVLASVTQRRLILCQTVGDLPAPLVPASTTITLSRSEGLSELRRQTLSACDGIGMPEDRSQDLVTAVNEAAMNAVVHSGKGIAQICVQPDTGVVQAWITDHGKGIALEDLPQATLRKGYTTAGTLGHGMKMMLETADSIHLLTGETGTTVVIEQKRTAATTDFS